ncbi:centromere protein J-like [Oncorhynchus keta]|uniref:centromere protein J-like n=1 Tax=Oncorhynchus keta TaxID=8018 RepID=UPI0015FAB824|nr:centromere protein J-like [Oncorhynchus keta]
MSSPAGLQAQQSQTKFLDRWMTSNSCAGVILNPSPDLAESLRHSSVWRSRDVNDSFASQFVPLPVSSSSSCLSISSLVHDAESGTELSKQNQLPVDRTLSDRQFAGLQTVASQGLTLPGEMDSMEKFVDQSQDLPLMLKLERLRQWQQHMQEQLKAHQLEELVSLQEEQQRLLGMVHVAQQDGADYIEISKLTGENTLLGGYPLSHRPPAAKSFPIGPPQGPASSQLWRRGPTFQQPPRGQEQEKDQTLGTEAWSNPHKCHQLNGDADDRGGDEEVTLSSHSAPSMTEDYKAYRGDDCELDSQDRPIKPGIGGQKQTFEALLEEQLRLEEQRLKTTQQQQSPEAAEGASPKANTKRAFLRRGEGLSRFTNRSKAPMPNRGGPQKDPQAKVSTRWTSEPTQKVSQRPPVQRKTAVLNKENRPRDPYSPLLDSVRPEGKTDKLAAVRPRVLGSHQRQNIEMTNCLRPMEVISNKVGGTSQPVSRTPAAVTEQFGLEERTGALQRNGSGPSRPDGAAEGKSGVPEYSFELSFQEKLQHWDCDRQKESVELGEFELLEQAAEELSFSSNSSFVMKVLQLDQQHPLQGSRGSRPRRLSSTPIKSPSLPNRVHSWGTSRSGQGTGTSSSESPGVSAVRAKRVMRENSKATDEEEEDEVSDGKHEEISDTFFRSSSEFGDREEVARPSYQTTVSSNLWENPLPASNPPYDKRSYQDREGGSSQAEEGGQSDLDDSTLLEDRENVDHEGLLVFDDDDTWNDLEEAGSIVEDDSRTNGAATGNQHTSTATVNDISPSERTLKRKVAVAKGTELERMSVITAANQEPDPPPTSQLMARLFPSLKPKTQAPSLPEPRKTEDGSGQQQSRQLRERLVELELEIERFRTENAALARLRQENEKNQEKLRKECAEFEQRKAEELAKFEEFKREETKKLQKERKVFERHASAARAIPDKRERDEIQAMKKQLSFLQEELKRRESRWSTTHNRLRQQIDSLSSDNSNLKDEVRTMEKLRLSTWRKIGTDGERENDRREKERGREGPRPLDSYIALEARCLKLASPPDTVRSSQPQSSISSKGSPSGHSPTTQGGIRGILKRSGPTPAPSPAHSYSSEDRPESLTRSHHPAQSHDHSNNLSPRARGLQTETEVKEQQEPGQDVLTHSDGKMERVLACGGRLIIFPNGTRKEVSADGLTVKVTFFNGDIKQVMADQRVIYYYADAQTTHTTYPDGIEVLQFPNNQTEKHFPDGRKEITFPDQTVKNLYPDGREESVLTDGTIIQVNLDGSKEIQFNTGQKEIHTADYKRREYPDGTLKTVYTDGRQETRYPTGRLRVKDKDGNIVMDNRP